MAIAYGTIDQLACNADVSELRVQLGDEAVRDGLYEIWYRFAHRGVKNWRRHVDVVRLLLECLDDDKRWALYSQRRLDEGIGALLNAYAAGVPLEDVIATV